MPMPTSIPSPTVKRFASLLLAAVSLSATWSGTAEAQRKSPLADAPAVRNRVELRNNRFEAGVGVGPTLSQDFYHAVMLNIRAGFHINDWIGLGGVVGLNLSPTFKTGFNERLDDALMGRGNNDKAPEAVEAAGSMNRIGYLAGLQLELTPFSGKFSMFGKLFMNYDFYAFLGPGVMNLVANDSNVPVCQDAADTNTVTSCAISGTQIGGNFGFGAHVFINDFVAINAELRDILIRNNPAGRDVNGDKIADKGDLTWDSNYMFTLGLTVYLPATPPITP